METEGGAEPRPEDPRRAPIMAPASIPVSFDMAKAIRELPLVYDLSGIDSASSAPEDHQMNRSSYGCRSVPGRFCGFVPPFHYAMAFAVEAVGERSAIVHTLCPSGGSSWFS